MKQKKNYLKFAFIIVGAGVLLSACTPTNTGEMVQPTIGATEIPVEAPTEVKDPVNDSLEVGEYEVYSKASFEKAMSEGKKAVLFFHAEWCPTCKLADAEFNEKLDEIPTDVVILKAEYDDEKDLKAKYGVIAQDTFVQVDESGELVAKWNSGGAALKSLEKNLV